MWTTKHLIIPLKKSPKEKKGPHQKLTYGHTAPVAKICPKNIFKKEIVPRSQPSRAAKNGTDVQGFYKTASPSCKTVKSDSSGSAKLAVLSPKPSVKGKFKCQSCVQSFNERGKLLDHIFALHTKKTSFACTRCKITYGEQDEFKEHMRQHEADDAREVKRTRANVPKKRKK